MYDVPRHSLKFLKRILSAELFKTDQLAASRLTCAAVEVALL